MKLILLTGDDFFEITDVKLKDGIIPCLSGISYSGNDYFVLPSQFMRRLVRMVGIPSVAVMATVIMCRVQNQLILTSFHCVI